MATTFNWIYLGTSGNVLDPTEGNTLAEGRNLFLGQTFGSSTDPLYSHITSATMINNGGSATSLDANNSTANDQFSTNIGAGTQTFVFDSSVQYNATITYADGTTATVTAVFVQSTTGEMFLAPETAANADTTAYEAKPIQSITFNSVAQTGANLGTDRQVTGWDDGVVDGTSGNDLIDSSYVEPTANGTDKIDGGDGTSSAATGWNDDNVQAGAGNDTVLSGLGNDRVDGGSGNDLIQGDTGAPAGTTFILNGNFSSGSANWGGTDTEFGPHSSYYSGGSTTDTLSEVDGAAGQTTVLTQSFNVSGAQSAVLTFNSRTRDGGTAGTDGYIVEVRDSLGNVISTTTVLPPTGSWVSNSVNFNFPGAGTYQLRITEIGNDNSVGALIDNIQITATSAAVGTGNDTITGGAGDDTILGQAGDDSIDGGTEADSVDGGDGNDSLFGGAGTFNDTILGGAGNDTIDGGDGNDSLLGGSGTDSITAGTGDDYVDAGIGDDTIIFGAGNDTVLGGDGNDFIDDQIGPQLAGANSLDGGAGNDTIYAGAGNDALLGGDGNDQLFGEDGDDTLNGGAGLDTMTGGQGSDRFLGITAGDVVDGSEDAGNTDTDILDLFGSGWTKANTNIIFSAPGSESGTVQFLDNLGNVTGTMTFSNIETVVPCFTPGTMIETDRGPVAVEVLTAGDRVRTRDNGLQTIRWIGRRDLSATELEQQPKLRPVLIRAGAIGPGLPARDLRVSPQHRILLTGAIAELICGEAEALAPAVYFVGQPGIVRDAAATGASYIHLMFDRHEIVQSDGIWSESFQPGAATLSGMDAAQRDEIFSLFPGLPAGDALAYPSARATLKRFEVLQILAA